MQSSSKIFISHVWILKLATLVHFNPFLVFSSVNRWDIYVAFFLLQSSKTEKYDKEKNGAACIST